MAITYTPPQQGANAIPIDQWGRNNIGGAQQLRSPDPRARPASRTRSGFNVGRSTPVASDLDTDLGNFWDRPGNAVLFLPNRAYIASS